MALPELTALARANGVQLRYEATVMAGTPCFQLLEHGLRGLQIEAVRGILNGTTNYILTQMEGGMSYADALAQAQALGYAETDPTADVDGWDAAGKLRILGAVIFGKSLTFENLSVQGISQLTTQEHSRRTRTPRTLETRRSTHSTGRLGHAHTPTDFAPIGRRERGNQRHHLHHRFTRGCHLSWGRCG
ncbi:MAG UNVERIFIED_CONTAM: hypothetical protein LVT10_11425 [Anaerolineae bacterium]